MSKHKKNRLKKNGVVTLSPIALVIGVLCDIFFLIFIILSINSKSYGIAIGFCIFELLGLSLIVAYVNCRIYYEPNQFTYKNFFGLKRTYKYSEITGIKYGASDTIIYIGKKKVLVDSMADSKNFLKLVNSKTSHSVKNIKSKLFNDNVYNPGEFIFAYSIVPLFIIGVMIFLNILGKPLKLEDLNCITTKITFYNEYINDEGNTHLELSLEGYNPNFVIYFYQEDMENFSQFESAVSSEVDFNIYFDKSVEDFENTGSGVDMLTDIDGNTYLSLDTTNARDKENLTTVNVIMSILLVAMIIFMLIAFYVMSHADRFPNATKLFVKDSYIKR